MGVNQHCRGQGGLNPIIEGQSGSAEGIVRLFDEEDLRVRVGVVMWRRSARYGGARLWMAL